MELLIVDDDPEYVSLLSEQLQAWDFDPRQAATLAGACAACEASVPGLALLDLALPDASGLQGLKTLLARFPELPVVVLTCLKDEAMAVEAVRAGAQEYIIKGEAGPDSLNRVIRYAFERAGILRRSALNEARLESLNRIATFKSSSAQELLDFALQETIRLTQSSLGYIYHYDGDRKEFRLNSWSRGVMKECSVADPQTIYPLEKTGVWGDVVRSRGPVLINDYAAPHPSKKGLPEGHVKLTSFLAIPVFSGEEITGTVGVANRRTPYTDEDVRQLTLMMNSVWEICAKKDFEAALLESETKFRTLFNYIGDAVFLVELGPDGGMGKFVEVNEAACARLGYSRGELLGMTPLDVYAPENIHEGRTAFDSLVPGRANIFEIVHRARDGRRIPVEVSVRKMEYGGRPCLLSIARDISERKKAAAERRLLSETIKASFNEIYIFDDETLKFKFVNDGALRNIGYAEDEMHGMTPLDIAPDFDEASFRAFIEPLHASPGTNKVFTARHQRKDGSFYPVEVHLQHDADNKVFLAVILDTTERRRMQDDLMRTQKIESLGVIAAGIAHDFNNMLMGITANLSLLATRNPDGDGLLQDALSAAGSARALTTQLLAFAKGGQPVKEEVCLEGALREVFSLATRGSSLNSGSEVSDGLWSVSCDIHQLKQAFTNILINAVQAMSGGGTLRMKAENLEVADGRPAEVPPGNYLRVTISDTGTGIPAKYLDRIFEPYFSTKEKGHGLGLSMVWSVVNSHGGHIYVSSEPGAGTEFRVWLPASGSCLGIPEKTGGKVRKGSGRVLLLEDEEIVSRAACRMLSELGYGCEITRDGRETLAAYAGQKAAGRPFSAVILDLTIPGGMGGKEAGAELRRQHPEAVLIASSGYFDEPVMAEYRDNGFDAVLPKPYRFEDLAETLVRLLEKA